MMRMVLLAAARKYKRMVQQGSKRHSSPALRKAVQKMNAGESAQIFMAQGLCFKARITISKTRVKPGPAPKREFPKNRFHYDWRRFWDTGNGDFGNQWIHEVNVARWGLGVTHPVKVSAIGGKFMFDDNQETPNTLNCAYEFNVNGKPKMMEFEVRHWDSHNERGIGRPNKCSGFMGKDQKPGPSRFGARHAL